MMLSQESRYAGKSPHDDEEEQMGAEQYKEPIVDDSHYMNTQGSPNGSYEEPVDDYVNADTLERY